MELNYQKKSYNLRNFLIKFNSGNNRQSALILEMRVESQHHSRENMKRLQGDSSVQNTFTIFSSAFCKESQIHFTLLARIITAYCRVRRPRT